MIFYSQPFHLSECLRFETSAMSKSKQRTTHIQFTITTSHQLPVWCFLGGAVIKAPLDQYASDVGPYVGGHN